MEATKDYVIIGGSKLEVPMEPAEGPSCLLTVLAVRNCHNDESAINNHVQQRA
jgi:hypothetical protein